MSYKTLRERILSNPQVQKEYDKNKLYFEVAQMVIEARIKQKMSQKELAKRIGTKQPSIARIESGSSLPSLRLLKKIANALRTELRVKFLKDEQDSSLGIPYTFKFDAPSTADERETKDREFYDSGSESILKKLLITNY